MGQIYNRRAVLSELSEYCIFAKEHDFIEVCEWANMDGVDVEISAHNNTQRFQLTWGEFKALKKLVKKLKNTDA